MLSEQEERENSLAAVRAENKAALAQGREVHRVRPEEKARPS